MLITPVLVMPVNDVMVVAAVAVAIGGGAVVAAAETVTAGK